MVIVLVMTLIVFAGVNMIGNPVDLLIAPDADQAQRQAAIVALGLDQPLWKQYLTFLSGIVHGNFGVSFIYAQPSLQVILQKMPATLELAVCALFLAVIVGIPLGLFAGLRPRSYLSRAIMTGSILGFSLPTFWVGLILIMIFSVALGWLPAGGRGETRDLLGIRFSFLTLDGLKHLILPAFNLSLFKISLVIRLTRAGVREILPLDYVKFARAKGLRESRVIFVHVLRNLLIPVITVIGLEFGSTLAFSVVTESIFAWPGMGKLIIDSINLLDRPMIVCYLIVIVIIFVIINLVVDLLYIVLDPRVRSQKRG
jgi:peptide/nickel transport system permease protein